MVCPARPHPAQGLGKTVQLASFLAGLHASGLFTASLVVCPATVLRQWMNELHVWAPPLRVFVVHDSARSRGGAPRPDNGGSGPRRRPPWDVGVGRGRWGAQGAEGAVLQGGRSRGRRGSAPGRALKAPKGQCSGLIREPPADGAKHCERVLEEVWKCGSLGDSEGEGDGAG
eukprot:363518-Chlamydomonas_euryale.AAC.6